MREENKTSYTVCGNILIFVAVMDFKLDMKQLSMRMNLYMMKMERVLNKVECYKQYKIEKHIFYYLKVYCNTSSIDVNYNYFRYLYIFVMNVLSFEILLHL